MNINQFEKLTKHPFEMLASLRLKHTMECESVLALILSKCIDAQSFAPVELKHYHPALVDAGLVTKTGPKEYQLTRKGKGYLYAYYGVESPPPQSNDVLLTAARKALICSRNTNPLEVQFHLERAIAD